MWRVVVAAVVTLASLGLPPSGHALADEFVVPSPPAPGYYSDSDDVWYCIHPDIDESQRTHIHAAMTYLDSATDLYDVYTSSCGTKTDIWFLTSDKPGGLPSARGAAQCVKSLALGMCDTFWITYNPALIYATSTDAFNYIANLSKTIRHEVGHTTGLRHSNGGGAMGHCMKQSPPCSTGTTDSYRAMKSGWVGTDGMFYGSYNPHHVQHVNDAY